jgi:hypothetical protein
MNARSFRLSAGGVAAMNSIKSPGVRFSRVFGPPHRVLTETWTGRAEYVECAGVTVRHCPTMKPAARSSAPSPRRAAGQAPRGSGGNRPESARGTTVLGSDSQAPLTNPIVPHSAPKCSPAHASGRPRTALVPAHIVLRLSQDRQFVNPSSLRQRIHQFLQFLVSTCLFCQGRRAAAAARERNRRRRLLPSRSPRWGGAGPGSATVRQPGPGGARPGSATARKRRRCGDSAGRPGIRNVTFPMAAHSVLRSIVVMKPRRMSGRYLTLICL